MSKFNIRKHFLKQRDEISVRERVLLSARINSNLLQQEEFTIAKNIASFKTFRNEPKLTQAKNKFYFYPKITDSALSCLLFTSPSPRDRTRSRMPSSA